MRTSTLLAATGLSVLAALASAAPASADSAPWPVCAGTANTAVFCVHPTAGTLYEDCVYTGGSSCTNVSVPGPTLSCGGKLIDPIFYCG